MEHMTWQDIIRLHVHCPSREGIGVVALPQGQVPESLLILADRMNVALDSAFPVEIDPSWCGARALPGLRGSRGNRVRLGGALAGKLSPVALESVLAHELAHLKCRHWELLLLGTVLAALGGLAVGLAVDVATWIRLLLGGGVLVLAAAALSWVAEYEADSVAARYVGRDKVAMMLEELKNNHFRRVPELTHPTDALRLHRLRRIRIPRLPVP
jgi:Zn-dependent protease with chaperone function